MYIEVSHLVNLIYKWGRFSHERQACEARQQGKIGSSIWGCKMKSSERNRQKWLQLRFSHPGPATKAQIRGKTAPPLARLIRCAKLRGTPRASGKAKGAQHALRLNKPLKSFCTSGLTTAGCRSRDPFRILPFMEQNHHPLILSYQDKQQ